MPDSSGEKLCPICDSPLQPGSKKCGFCGTDLSIFEIDMEPVKKTPEPAPPAPAKMSVEARVDEILTRPSPVVEEKPAPPTAPPVAPKPPEHVMAEPPKPQPLEVRPSPAPEPEPEPVVEEKSEEAVPAVEYFECPQCGAAVETTATSCSKCGVLFAEEGGEMFQCPACNTLVNVDANSCPGCGALFVEAEEAAPAAPAPTPAKKELEAPVAEVKAPPAKKPEKPPAPEPKVEEKKGLFGMFKFGKKEPEAAPKPAPPKPEKPVLKVKPAPTPAPAAPKPTPPPAAPAKVFREVAVPAPSAPAPAQPPARDKGRDLARMVAEMKPLLALAREKEVDIGESKQLIDEAAEAGRDRQIDKAIELVQNSKTVLMGKIDTHLSQVINQLNEEIKIAREFGGDISRATTYIQEVARARSSGDIEASFVYADKVSKELLPITGRYNESKKKIAGLKQFISDCEMFIVDTKEARRLVIDAQRALEQKDFDKMDTLIRNANDSLQKAIPARMNEEMKKAKDVLLEAKVRNVNITPMLTVLKSATNLMKSGDYAQAIKEMREFKEMMKKAA